MSPPLEIQMVVKNDRIKNTHRISIPKIIRDHKGWNKAALYRITLKRSGEVIIDEYISEDALEK